MRSASARVLVWLILVFWSSGLAAQIAGSQPQVREQRDIERQRQMWFYGQRAYPHEHVPAGAWLNAHRELNLKIAREMAAGIGAATNPNWTLIGPKPVNTPYTDPVVAGRISAVAVDPTNSSVVYAGAAEGGIWKTTNGGTNWTPLTDRQVSLATGSIAIDPTNSQTIYVGTGEANYGGDAYYGAGILKSTSGGSSWTHICGPFCGPIASDSFYGGGARILGLAISPANNQVILAAVQLIFKDGIYRSADGGSTWTQVLSGNPGSAVLFDAGNGGVAYAALGSEFSGGTEGVYKSTDYGQTWTAINGSSTTALPLASAGVISMAMTPSTNTTSAILYAGIENVNTGSLVGLYKSSDGGNTWSSTGAPDYCNPQCAYDNVIGVDPANANVIYAGGAFTTTLIRSTNGGITWAVLQSAATGNPSGFMHSDLHAIRFSADGTTVYIGNDGGMYKASSPASSTAPTFTALNSTLAVTQFYPGISIDPASATTAIGGTQDNGTELYSGMLAWNDVVCGDGGGTAIDPSAPSTMYTVCTQTQIQKSTMSGAFGSWSAAASGIGNDHVEFIPRLAIDPTSPNNLYFGTQYIYQTTNSAASWTKISPVLTPSNGFWSVVTAMAVAPSNSNVVYAATGDSHVWSTSNALSGTGSTWTNRSSTALPPRIITALAVDPATATTVYVAFSGFKGFGDTKGHVFKSTNSGASWSDITSDLPNIPVNEIVINPANRSEIFVATDIGVFYTTSGGQSWTTLVNGLPRSAVLSLALHASSNTLFAGTHGRSVWNLNTSTLLPVVAISSISPTSVAHGSGNFVLTVNGSAFDSNCAVRWNGSALTTTFVSATKLTATVPASDVVNAGKAKITAFDSSTNITSNSVIFTIQ